MINPIIFDSFAGGGGASTGIEIALGRSPDIAINHNADALALHAANHPQTLHLSENVYKIDPLDHLRRQHVGLAWFSPDCKHFSKAKGGKPVERNIRDLAWIIPGWIERIQKSGGKVDVVIMENVEEWKDWGPLIETPKGLFPDPDRRGETFEAWCKAIKRLGGKMETRELRACDYGAPTIRKRLFVIIRFDKRAIVWPEPTHAAPDSEEVRSGRKLPWRVAADIIDWSRPCPSIFDTREAIKAQYGVSSVRPLADNTLARVARGTKRYVLDAEKPFIVQTGYGERKGQEPRCIDIDLPLGTVVAGGIKHAVVVPHVSAFYGRGNGGKDRSAPVDEPLRVVTTENRHALIAPVLTYAQQGGACRSVTEPHHTITASLKDQNAVIIPNLMSLKGSARRDVSVLTPHPTVLAGGGHSAIITPFVAQHNNDSRRIGGVNPGRPIDEPLSTVTAIGAQQGIVAPFLQAYYGTGEGAAENEPMRTITTKDRHGHVEAHLSAPPFTEAQHERARQVADLLRSHGFWDDREFVTLTISGIEFVIVDIGMRMLTPRELYNAQGFPSDYIIDGDGQGGAFSKSVQVSCVGNSVSPPVAAALVSANCGCLAQRLVAAE